MFIAQNFGACDFPNEAGNFQSVIKIDEDDCFKVEANLKKLALIDL